MLAEKRKIKQVSSLLMHFDFTANIKLATLILIYVIGVSPRGSGIILLICYIHSLELKIILLNKNTQFLNQKPQLISLTRSLSLFNTIVISKLSLKMWYSQHCIHLINIKYLLN